jgi:hypothetical protein
VSHNGPTNQRQGALMESLIPTTRSCYAEWIIEEAGPDCNIMVGVTALRTVPPVGQYIFGHPSSRMYCCWDSNTYPGGRSWGPTGRLSQGDRVGLMVKGSSMSVYVNGALLGPGPMATDLPQQVCLQLYPLLFPFSITIHHTDLLPPSLTLCAEPGFTKFHFILISSSCFGSTTIFMS